MLYQRIILELCATSVRLRSPVSFEFWGVGIEDTGGTRLLPVAPEILAATKHEPPSCLPTWRLEAATTSWNKPSEILTSNLQPLKL